MLHFVNVEIIFARMEYIGTVVQKKILNSKSPNVHLETLLTFKKHKNFKKNRVGNKISTKLNKLRVWRNRADYDDKMNDVDNILLKSKSLTEEILNLLDEI